MYLINPHSPNSKWKVRDDPYLYTLEFVVIYPLFSVIVFSYSYKDRKYLRTENDPEYVSLLELFYDIEIIINSSGYTTNSLRNIPAEKLQTFLNLAIQNHKGQGKKCSSEELLDTFLKIKDSVPYLSSLYMSN